MKLKSDSLSLDLKRWHDAFDQYNQLRNMSPNSRVVYNRVIRRLIVFSEAYDNIVEIDAVNRILITKFLNYSADTWNLSATTKKHYLDILKAFFMFISQENSDAIDLTPIFRNFKIKLEKKERDFFSRDEIMKIYEYLAIQTSKGKFEDIVTSLAFKLLFLTGIRASELLSIRLLDLVANDQVNYRILIKGKGAKQRYVYIPIESVEEELTYLKKHLSNSDFLICTKEYSQIARENLYLRLSALYKRVGLNKRGVHIVRHSTGRLLKKQGIDLETIREMYGHSDIRTTAYFYAKSDEEDHLKASKSIYNSIREQLSTPD